MKRTILASGDDTRLYLLLMVASKQPLLAFEICYPLSMVMVAEFSDILIISTTSNYRFLKHSTKYVSRRE